jgi:tetratricopeptide (TPR) repeat protein
MELKYILLCHYNNLTPAEKSNCFLFIGDSLKATKEYTEAINYYYQAILADETYREAYFALADTLNIIGKFKHAIVVLEECLEKTYRHYN